MRNILRLGSWEKLLLGILVVVIIFNVTYSPFYLSLNNQINLFVLSIEKIIVALIMTLIIINAEIDLSVASIMGLAAAVLASMWEAGYGMGTAIFTSLLVGALCGAINGFWIAYGGLPSLAVTLAGLIGFRGAARILVEDRSIGEFPEWFEALGQDAILGPFPLGIIIFFVGLVIIGIILQRSVFGRTVYVIGNNADVARYSGVKVKRVKMLLFVASGILAAVAGLLFAARLGSVRGNMAEGFELDIITMVLLGGVSIFGGSGSLTGVGLAILIVLNLRNGMSLANVTGNTQTGVIGLLLILSVIIPNVLERVQTLWGTQQRAKEVSRVEELKTE